MVAVQIDFLTRLAIQCYNFKTTTDSSEVLNTHSLNTANNAENKFRSCANYAGFVERVTIQVCAYDQKVNILHFAHIFKLTTDVSVGEFARIFLKFQVNFNGNCSGIGISLSISQFSYKPSQLQCDRSRVLLAG